jgi:hypothetical protein
MNRIPQSAPTSKNTPVKPILKTKDRQPVQDQFAAFSNVELATLIHNAKLEIASNVMPDEINQRTKKWVNKAFKELERRQKPRRNFQGTIRVILAAVMAAFAQPVTFFMAAMLLVWAISSRVRKTI